ncbi:MAG: carboxypeptidase-like regulatory domain-containing protein [Acidobacteriia bacterium]|nr:carboxypeptidase-like regulatory domain-containing protein [Terriglobia bacterium]
MKQVAFTLLLVCSLAAAADTLKGVVQNSTTNKPSAGDEVTLKKIGNGMEDVAKTKTNARGEFTFNVPPAQQPYLVWVQHQGVTYTQAGLPGGVPVAVRVFDAASSIKEISILDHAIAIQTSEDGATLSGEEFYTVGNQSSPPRTLTGKQTLEFYLPEGASLSESSVQTGKTQLKTAVVPAGEKNKYAFVFPIRPGQTQFHILYTLPYSGKLELDPRSDLPTGTLMVAAPDSIKFAASDSAVYEAKSNPQFKSVNFFIAKNVTPKQKVAFTISGKGAMPREQEQTASNGGAPGEPAGPGGGLGVPNERPDPLHSGQWLFLGVLSLFLAAGGVFVYTSNQNVAATAGPAIPQDRSALLMEAMKEEVFQLESDRLQGKINPQDYQTAKAALDKTLQRAVQRQSK